VDLNLAKIVHDFRTPISSIMMTTQQFKEEKLPAHLVDPLRQQESSCKFLLSVSEGMIDVSKISQGKFKQQRTWFNVRDVIHDVFATMGYLAELQSVKFDL